MLTEIYIEALLINQEMADQVWEFWDKGEMSDTLACNAWLMIAASTSADYRDLTSGGHGGN